jgi:hypothetical protein
MLAVFLKSTDSLSTEVLSSSFPFLILKEISSMKSSYSWTATVIDFLDFYLKIKK